VKSAFLSQVLAFSHHFRSAFGGKPSIAIDTILNQKELNLKGKENEKLNCVYVTMGKNVRKPSFFYCDF
jgi:hypothetical protein